MNGVGITEVQRAKNASNVAWPEPVADPLERDGIVARREAVRELTEADALVACLALGPLVSVQPDLGPVGEVGADLDEAGTEVGVEDVEVVHPDPAVFFHEVETHDTGLVRTVFRAEDPLELLGLDDGDDAGASRGFGPIEVGTDVVELAVVPSRPVGFLQLQDRHLMLSGEGLHLAAETVADLLEQRR